MRLSAFLLLLGACELGEPGGDECSGEVFVGTVTFSGESAADDVATFCEAYVGADAVRVEGTDWADLEPLACVCSIGSLSLVDNAALATTAPVRVEPRELAEAEVSGSPLLADLAAYRDVGGFGSLHLAELDLANLDDLAAATYLDDVRVEQMPSLVSIDGLAADVRVGELVLESAPLLASIGEWGPPRTLAGLTLSGTAVPTLSGLEDTASLSRLALVGNSELGSLSGFPLTTDSLVSLSVGDSPALVSLASLSGVTALYHLSLQSLAPEATLAGLGSLSQVGGLNVTGIPALRSLNGLEGLRYVTSTGIHIEVSESGAALVDLSALDGLQSVVGGVTITGQVTGPACQGLWESLKEVIDASEFSCGTFEPD